MLSYHTWRVVVVVAALAALGVVGWHGLITWQLRAVYPEKPPEHWVRAYALGKAIEAYVAATGHLPIPTTLEEANEDVLLNDEDYAWMIDRLASREDIVTIRVDRSGKFLDPYGEAYRVVLDINGDGRVPRALINGWPTPPGGDPSFVKVGQPGGVIWSLGPDRAEDSTTEKTGANSDNHYWGF